MQGQLSIARLHGDPQGDKVLLEIEDPDTGVKVVQCILTMEQFGHAITGLGHRPCDVTVRCRGGMSTAPEEDQQ
jgi:hypothetical protein